VNNLSETFQTQYSKVFTWCFGWMIILLKKDKWYISMMTGDIFTGLTV